MKGVLVDTSVWIEHFRHRNDALMALLARDQAMIHPLVLGEIACGTPPNRLQTLSDLDCLQPTLQASLREVIAFIDKEQLFGQGCGLVDLTLLASTLLTPGAKFWTLDKRLNGLAERFDAAYCPTTH